MQIWIILYMFEDDFVNVTVLWMAGPQGNILVSQWATPLLCVRGEYFYSTLYYIDFEQSINQLILFTFKYVCFWNRSYFHIWDILQENYRLIKPNTICYQHGEYQIFVCFSFKEVFLFYSIHSLIIYIFSHWLKIPCGFSVDNKIWMIK